MRRLSVVICTKNRAGLIPICLNAVAHAFYEARLSKDSAEIIVVNNGSTDGTATELERWSEANPDMEVMICDEPITGLSRARNLALGKVTGELVIFTDDDCRMAPDYILKAIAYDAADKKEVIRGGRIELGDPADIPLTIKISDQPAQFNKSNRSAKQEKLSGFISGCNMVMRKSTLDRIGKFDELLGAGSEVRGSDDTDYLLRGYLAGIDIEYVPDMTVYHFHGRKTRTEGKKLLQGYNMGAGALYIKHLFKDIDLLRPFAWNIRNALTEMKTGKNLYLPEFDASYKEVVYMNLVGMWRYACVLLWSVLSGKSRGKQV